MATLLETAANVGSFKTFLAAVEKAGLAPELENPGPFTLLAPTDQAFEQLPAGTLEKLLEDQLKLKKVLSYHVLFGDVRSDDLAQIDEAPTVEGSVVAVDHDDTIRVNDMVVTQMDILADNGVIHVIEGVLMPAIVAGS